MFPGESIVSFKLDKLLKYATQFPGGLYSDSHSVIMNPDRWNKISKADQAAIEQDLQRGVLAHRRQGLGQATPARASTPSRPAAATSCRPTRHW